MNRKCDRCAEEFDPTSTRQCGSCGLRGGCHSIKCPHCGYEMGEQGKLFQLMKAWWRSVRA